MASNLLQMGSSGSRVKELQELLNQNGYQLTVDGIYGAKTRSAVQDYQKKNTLQVDGIVGDETWGALTRKTESEKSENTANSDETVQQGVEFSQMDTSQRLENYEDEPPQYVSSEQVLQAQKQFEQLQAQKPTAFVGSYDEQIDQVLQSILNPEAFRYDPLTDAAWQAYREQYTQGGRQAALDTLGQAASLTGGYANSYAQTAAAQAYQQYMTALSAKLPQLQEAAYGRYRDEQESLYDRAALLLGLQEEEYERYRDEMGDWQEETDNAYAYFRDLYDADWERYEQARSEWEADRSYYYKKQLNEAEAAQQAAAAAAKSGGSGGGSSAKSVKRTLSFSNYLSRATTQYNANGPQGLLNYLNVNRDAEGATGLTDAEIQLICRQFGYSSMTALRTAAKNAQDADKKVSTGTSTNKNTAISVR